MKQTMTVLLFTLCLFMNTSNAKGIDSVDGYPCCNFKIGANISAEGNIFGNIIHNPSQYGRWLDTLGHTTLSITHNGNTLAINEFQNRTINRNWPFVTMTLQDPSLSNITINITSFAPLAYNDDFTSSLPVIMTEITFNNCGKHTELTLALETENFLKGQNYQQSTSPAVSLFSRNNHFIGWCNQDTAQYQNNSLTTNVILNPNKTKTMKLLIGTYDDNSKTAQKLNSPLEIAEYACQNWDKLKSLTLEFSNDLPQVDDPAINKYLRWHMMPAIILTKNMKDGNVLTMGYSELNQRDSYWTSFTHLLFWPDLEKKMILESMEYQRKDGKIPTTILPLIERNDDIDITCYFILRIARYYKYHKDTEFLNKCYPAMEKAIAFLDSLDNENSGMPQQHSFWADWKDVSGINGRKYAPHIAFTYLAALKEMEISAKKLNHTLDAEIYRKKYVKAATLTNRPVEEGGLWNGRYYQQTWFDTKINKTNQKLLQDQVVGIIFDVMPKERVQMVLKALDNSITKYGAAETTPYYPDSFGYQQGSYHNGGVWPYMNYIHSWALIKAGRKEDGINLMKKCSWATLENNDKFLPYEYVNSIDGHVGGHCIQGWNANFLAAVYFGILDNPWNQ